MFVMFASITFGWDLSLAPGLSVKNAFLYTIIVVFMIETAVYHNRRFELPSVLVPFGLFVGYSIVSWFAVAFVFQLTNYPLLKSTITLKSERIDHLLFFLLFFYGLTSTKDVAGLLRTFLWLLVIGNVVTVVDAFNIPDLGIIQQRRDGRLGGPMGESNQYGAMLALTLPAIIALVWDSQTKRFLAYFASFASIVALLLASSRGSFVAIVVGSIFSVYYLRAYIAMRHVATGVIVSAAVIAVIVVIAVVSSDLGDDLIQRFADTLSGGTVEVSSGRTYIWASALQQMTDQPLSFLIGFGWDVYDLINKTGYGTHNVYLNHWFDLGLPGLILYCALTYNLLSNCRRAISNSTGFVRSQLIAFVFGFASLSVALFFVDLKGPWMWVWVYSGMVMRLVVASTQPNEDEMKAC
jgi:hypothetical protein